MEIQQIQKVWSRYHKSNAQDLTQLNPQDIERKLKYFFSPGPFVTFIYDFGKQGITAIHAAFESMFGIPTEEVTIERVLQLIHPEDLLFVSRCEQMIGSFMFENLPPEHRLEYKASYCFRAKTVNGYRLFLHQAMGLVMDDHHHLSKVLNVHADITDMTTFNNHRLSLIGTGDLPSYLCIDVTQHQTPTFQKNTSYVTPREREVVRLLAEGGNTKEIAEAMSIADATVSKHRENLLRKAGAKNTTQLVVQFIREGLL